MVDSKYVWPFLSGIYILLWLSFYLFFKPERKSLLFGFAFCIAGPIYEFISIPEYWNPTFLIPFYIQTPIKTWYFGLEDFVSSIAYSGICFGLFEKLNSKNKTVVSGSDFKIISLLVWTFLGLTITSFLYFIIGMSGINSTNLGMFCTGWIYFFFNRKYLKSGILTTVIMVTSYMIVLRLICLPIFPDMFFTTWNLRGSVFIVGVPLHELIWAVCSSFVAGPTYRIAFTRSADLLKY